MPAQDLEFVAQHQQFHVFHAATAANKRPSAEGLARTAPEGHIPWVLEMLGAFIGVFAGVVVVLLAAVGQLGKVDRETLIVVLVVGVVAAGAAAARTRRV